MPISDPLNRYGDNEDRDWVDGDEDEVVNVGGGGSTGGGGGTTAPPDDGPPTPGNPEDEERIPESRTPTTSSYTPIQFTPPTRFERQPFTMPPPPAPPPAPPPPPNFMGAAQVTGLPEMPEWQAPGQPGESQDFLGILDRYWQQQQDAGEEGPGFNVGDYVGEGPDLMQHVQGGGYETPENAFLGENLYGDLEAYARDWMGNHNPYDNDYSQAARAEMEGRLDQQRDRGTRDIEEWAASRGLGGSSEEGLLNVELGDRLSQQERETELGIYDRMIGAEAEGRAGAGNFGLSVAEFGRRLGETRINEAATAEQLAQARGRLQVDTADRQDAALLSRAALHLEQERAQFDREGRLAGLALNAAQMQEQSTQFRAQFDLQVQNSGFDAAFRTATLQSQQAFQQAELNLRAAVAGDNAAMSRAQLALDTMRAMDNALLSREELRIRNDDLDMRAWATYEGLVQSGQQMEFNQVKFIEEMDFRREELAEKARQFDEDLTYRYWNTEQSNARAALGDYGLG